MGSRWAAEQTSGCEPEKNVHLLMGTRKKPVAVMQHPRRPPGTLCAAIPFPCCHRGGERKRRGINWNGEHILSHPRSEISFFVVMPSSLLQLSACAVQKCAFDSTKGLEIHCSRGKMAIIRDR